MPTEKPNLMVMAMRAGMTQDEFKDALVASLTAMSAAALLKEMCDRDSNTPNDSFTHVMDTKMYGRVEVTVDFEYMDNVLGVKPPITH